MTTEAIKQAVNEGKLVCWCNPNNIVKKALFKFSDEENWEIHHTDTDLKTSLEVRGRLVGKECQYYIL